MDDDLTFGSSVWDTPTSQSEKAFSALNEPTNEFGDLGDFAPAQEDTAGDNDDFGDFDDAEQVDAFDPVLAASQSYWAAPGPSSWTPLRLHPMPPQSELAEQVNAVLEPMWNDYDISASATQEAIREAPGMNQILASSESRALANILFREPPAMKPPNWLRSRIRRQHLITLGVPVNLDEMLPAANARTLPPIHITTRPMSAPPGPQQFSRPSSAHGTPSRPGTPSSAQNGTRHQPGFGYKPELNMDKIQALLDFDPGKISMRPSLSELEQSLADIRGEIASTNSLLTYLLQIREALQQDSETYNKLIAELVGEAQKIKTGKGSGLRRTVSSRHNTGFQ
ncbi:hypothetical protein FISHEDRAFT_41732 [Fistulina hepatica ATCC 64428]|nr:hypothetical protein FISHEDRAFT_41732 [Fistulina hepatica ATCC 64428]